MSPLRFDPAIPPAVWTVLALAAAGLLVWYARGKPAGVGWIRWGGIIGLMGVGVASLLVIALNPVWDLTIPVPPGRPVLTILVDRSESMATRDVGGQSRYDAAVALAEECQTRLGAAVETRWASFAEAVTPVEASTLRETRPTGGVSDLAAAVNASALTGRASGQAVLLLSDGIHNAGGVSRAVDAARAARAAFCPIYPSTLGGPVELKDVAVEVQTPQEIAFLRQPVDVTAVFRHRGFGGRKMTVVLEYQGKAVDRRDVQLQPGPPTEVRFRVSQDRAGLYAYTVRGEPLADESNRSNNSAAFLLRVIDKPLRVLLLEGKPYWDAKFLLRTLIADPSLEVDSVVRVGEARYLRHTRRREPGAPRGNPADRPAGVPDESDGTWTVVTDFATQLGSPEFLMQYQVVVLGRNTDVYLTPGVVTRLKHWLARQTGCLVCYRGQPLGQGSELAAVMPVRNSAGPETRIGVSLTERGRDARWLGGAGPSDPTKNAGAGGPAADDRFVRLPTLATTARRGTPRPLAVVLATSNSGGGEEPVVVYQPYGGGRVVVIEGAGMWRWALLPETGKQQDDVYRGLWFGLLRWIASAGEMPPGETVFLRSDKLGFTTKETATATLLVRDEGLARQPPSVELRPEPNGAAVTRTVAPTALADEPGVFRVTFGILPEGRYEAVVTGTPEGPSTRTLFEVRDPSEERLDLTARPELMERLARESGGRVLKSPADELAGELEKVRLGELQGLPPQTRPVPAWDRWWVLVGILAVMSATWAVRRTAGLV